MRRIEHTEGFSSNHSETKGSFTASPTESPPPPRNKVVSPNKNDISHTTHPRIRSLGDSPPSLFVGSPRTNPEQKIVATADTPDEHGATPHQEPEGQHAGNQSRNDEQREAKTDTGIVPPIEPPTDLPDASAENPGPQPPWERIQELAKIPPDPEKREEVADLHTMGINRLLITHEDVINRYTAPQGVEEEVVLETYAGKDSADIEVKAEQISGRRREGFIVSFRNAPDAEVKNTTYSYVQDSKGVVRKHIINQKVIEEQYPSVKHGDVQFSTLVAAHDAAYAEKIGPKLELERELGMSDEVGLAEMQYVLGLADKAIPRVYGASVLHTLYKRRLDGVPVGTADAEEGAIEFNKHIHNCIKKYGQDPYADVPQIGIEGETGEAPKGVKVAFQAGLRQKQPFAEIMYSDQDTGRVIRLSYDVVDSELISTRSVGLYIGDKLLDQQDTAVRGDVTEARVLRNFLIYPMARYDQELWQT